MGEQTNAAKIAGKYTVIAAVISSVTAIIVAIISVVSNNMTKKENATLTTENIELVQENNDWEIAYSSLQEQFDELNNKNSSLLSELDDLKNNMEQYSSLADENNSLRSEISELQNELQIVKENIANRETSMPKEDNQVETKPIPQDSGKKVSIFDLDTFKGDAYWHNSSYYDSENFIDTYGTEHLTAYVAFHKKIEKNSTLSITYLLDNQYSVCEGEIAWSKRDKNSKESAWIEFYSDDILLYQTEVITADSRPFSFSFDVSDVEKLTIVRNGSGNQYNSVMIIYPYFNLVE